MGKSSFLQLEEIKNDIRNISKQISNELSEKASKDLIKAHEIIIDKFYASHTPTSYRRHGIGGLYYSLISHTNKKNMATINVGYSSMEEHYRTSAENVFDLVWNSGIRGLPREGDSPLNHSFIYRSHNGHIINWGKKGQVWRNHYWSGSTDPYHNIFRTSINYEGLSTDAGTPHDVMYDFVDKWGVSIGTKSVDKIVKKIPKKSIVYK